MGSAVSVAAGAWILMRSLKVRELGRWIYHHPVAWVPLSVVGWVLVAAWRA